MSPSRPAWMDAAEAYSREHIAACCCGGVGWVRANLPVGHPLFGKAIPCVCRRDRQARERAEALRRGSGMTDQELSAWRFETFLPARSRPGPGQDAARVAAQMARVVHLCRAYAANPHGWLVLPGETGAGKTHLAFAIAAQALADGRAVYAASAPDLLNRLRAAYAEERFEADLAAIGGVELLVLDDLGAERRTEWSVETLYQIVNHRYAKRLPLVATTNCRLDQAGADQRGGSRLREGAAAPGGWSRWVTLPCADFRPQARGAGVRG